MGECSPIPVYQRARTFKGTLVLLSGKTKAMLSSMANSDCKPGETTGILVPVAENKLATVSFRTQEGLKASFEASLAALGSYGTSTAFFEDCMRAIVHHARRGEQIAVPVTFERQNKENDTR